MKTNKKWEYYNPPEKFTPISFCLDSSLHGLHYIGQKNRHCFERIFWIIAFISSVVFAGLLIYKLWETYTDSPIVTVFNSEETKVKNVAFPSVTICNVNRIKSSKATEYASHVDEAKQTSNQTLLLKSLAAIQDLKYICELETFIKRVVKKVTRYWSTFFEYFNEDLEMRMNGSENFTNPSKILFEASQNCSEMLLFCMWQDKMYNCSELFRPIVTDYGYCCTFNMIPPTLLMRYYNDSRDDPDNVKDWDESKVTFDNLILTSEKTGKFPYFQEFPGRTLGLSVMLEPNLLEYGCTSTDSIGFSIGLKSPLTFPLMEEDGMLIQPGAETFIKIHPQITISDKSIKRFPVVQRKCYFDGEIDLPHYTKYTATNCISECISEIAFKNCGCVSYYMPRRPGIRLCKPNMYRCVKNVEKNVTLSGDGCENCYRTCTDIRYQTDVTALHLRRIHIDKLYDAYPELNITDNISMVHFYFGDDAYPTRRRKEVYTIIDLISSAGGLLGLCLGFSILSLLEIIYYCTIRLCFIYRRKCIENANAKKVDLSISLYNGKIEADHLLKQWAQPVPSINWGKDPIVKLVQSRSPWKLKI